MLCRKERSEYLYNSHTHVIYVIGILGVDTDEPPSSAIFCCWVQQQQQHKSNFQARFENRKASRLACPRRC